MFSRENVKIADKTACSLLTETSAIGYSSVACMAAQTGQSISREFFAAIYCSPDSVSDVNDCEITSKPKKHVKEKKVTGKEFIFFFPVAVYHIPVNIQFMEAYVKHLNCVAFYGFSVKRCLTRSHLHF